MYRKALWVALAAGGALLWAAPAFANTTNLSFNPSYAAQPFSFYCDPYKYSFEDGRHYVVSTTTGSACYFTIPSAVTGSKIIAIYKGVPGNATFVAGDQVIGGEPTFIQETSAGFGSPAQDQDYFAVVYGYNNSDEGKAFDQELRSSSSTVITPPSGGYAVITWKWGAQPPSEFEPVIIIPGILGSWYKDSVADHIDGNGGEWVLDPIAHTYDNLIDTLLANGYVENKTLFTFPYDWEEPNEVTANLLAQKIQSIKEICGCSRVDLVGHSMGGLVAEQYVISTDYQDDVDQIIFLATPLLGAPEAYQAWEGGEVHFSNARQNAFMQTKFWAEAEENGYTNVYDYIQGKPIESIQELLPITDYLYDNTVGERVYPSGYPVNGFIENIIKHLNVIINNIRTTVVVADNGLTDTPSAFVVEPATTSSKWKDGEITDTFYDLGDGTVPRSDIEGVYGANADKYFYGTDHIGVVSTSSAYVFSRLTNGTASAIVNNSYDQFRSFVWFYLLSPVDMEITAPDGKHLGRDLSGASEVDEIPGAFYSGFGGDGPEYAIIPDPLPGTYQVITIGTGSGGTYRVGADYFNGSTTTEALLMGSTTPGQIIAHSAFISSTSTAVILKADAPAPQADTQPPLITITSPQTGRQYTHADTIKIAATIADDSPIASTTYLFNGKKINASTPLSLAGVPLGTSTITVLAADKFGNIGSSSIQIGIIATPDSCLWDLALAYKNKWIAKKNVYDALVGQCNSIKNLFKDRDGWSKFPIFLRDKKTSQLIQSNFSSIQSAFNLFDQWIKDKSNTKDAVQLLNQNLQWFKSH
ncbi:MAG TPA: Ig-like domain-containing protein [Candidatus Paceibacterota bacterium]|nr:Ig-like domain-containing protein [Candidatus Paceibacterota bacterium]